MQVALYARVSTERQERDQTITSQLRALQDWVQHHQHEVRPEHIYTDEGISGSRLDRPALDRLRDAAREGAFALVVVCSPDRLARKYAYQVLVLEEHQRAGCRVVFLQRPLSDDPQDQLLLQMQGVIAEYERAVLQERFRRGKLHRARAGQYLGGRAPYGYRYLHKRDQCPGTLVIDEDEAAIVRMLYQWVRDEGLTIRQVQKRLAAGPWRTRAGRSMWSTATVHHILTDPVYSGTAYVNRYCYHAPKKPRVLYPRRGQENTCRTLRPQEQWISVSVPALVDLTTYEHVQRQLARNAQLSWRRNRRYDYLLRWVMR
jgi:site-specific DNA recombinase